MEKIDWLGDLDITGKKVIHDVFGTGTITEFDGKSLIKVSFFDGNSKLFLFPETFIFNHMRFEDDELEEALTMKLADRKK